MRKLTIIPLFFACIFMLLPVVDDAEAGGLGKGKLRQDQLEIGRGMLEVQNVDWTTLLRYYADDIEYHDSIVDVYGIDDLTAFLARLYGSSPDLVTTIEDETVVGGVYSATWTMTGTFIGQVPYEAKGISIIKFRPGSREVYYWRDYYTEGDIMANAPGFGDAVAGFRWYYRCAVNPTPDLECPPAPATTDALPETTPLIDVPPSNSRAGGVVRLHRDRLTVGRALVEINAANWQSLLPYYSRRLPVLRSDRLHRWLRPAGALLRAALRQFARPGHHGRG